jgi:hypothetical protein
MCSLLNKKIKKCHIERRTPRDQKIKPIYSQKKKISQIKKHKSNFKVKTLTFNIVGFKRERERERETIGVKR